MKPYIYEMHQHTSPCSRCGRAEPVGLVRKLKEHGFAGMVLTDHFYNGNSGIDRALPWNEFCKAYEHNYLLAKEEGDKLGFDVIFGLEEHVGNGKEVLLYGITPEYMYSNPEIISGNLEIVSRCAHAAGALVIQAHPFRVRSYIPDPGLLLDPSLLDGYEIYNAGNPEDQDMRAVAYAQQAGGILTAGSDAHSEEAACRYGIAADTRICDERKLVMLLQSGNYELYREPRPVEY